MGLEQGQLAGDALGTTYGTGNGVDHVNLPHLRGRLTAGKDDMGGGPSISSARCSMWAVLVVHPGILEALWSIFRLV